MVSSGSGRRGSASGARSRKTGINASARASSSSKRGGRALWSVFASGIALLSPISQPMLSYSSHRNWARFYSPVVWSSPHQPARGKRGGYGTCGVGACQDCNHKGRRLLMNKLVGLAAGVLGLAIGMVGNGAPALAQANVQVGTLTCNVSGGWGVVFGSSKAVRCTFARAGGRPEHYAGSINKFRGDIGYTQGGVLVWGVFAPHRGPAAGAPSGNYVGAGGSATDGVRAGANGRVGGPNRWSAL